MSYSRKTITAQELALVYGMSVNGIVKRMDSQGVQPHFLKNVDGQKVRARGGRLRVYYLSQLPGEALEKVNNAWQNLPALSGEERTWAELPDWKREAASDRLMILNLLKVEYQRPENLLKRNKIAILEAFTFRYNKGLIDRELLKRTGKKSPRTVMRWMDALNEGIRNKDKDFRMSLVPSYGKRAGHLKVKPEEKLAIDNLILKGSFDGKRSNIAQNAIPVSVLYSIYMRQAQANGMTEISYSTFWRYYLAIPYITRVYYREGHRAFENKCLPSAIRGYDGIPANDWWSSDGHRLNVLARNPENDWVGRPTLVAWMDMGSRKIMGFDITETETKESVIGSFATSIRQNGYAIPANALLDNGKAYKNTQTTGRSRKRFYRFLGDAGEREIQGIFHQIGTRTHFTDPYNAKSKPIERLWGTVDFYFSKLIPAYTGKNAMDKPEYFNDLQKRVKQTPEVLPTISELRDRFGEFVEWYNARPHKGIGMGGRSPDEAYNETSDGLITINEQTLQRETMYFASKTIRTQGIKHADKWYRDGDGLYTLHLREKVKVFYDPADLSGFEVYDLNGKYLFRAEMMEYASLSALAGAKSENEIREQRKLRQKVTKYAMEGAKASGKLTSLANTVEIEAINNNPALSGKKDTGDDADIKDFGE